MADPRGCLGVQECKYLQKVEKKGKNIMESEPNCCSDKDFIKVETSQAKNTLVEENNSHHTGDDQNQNNESYVKGIVIYLDDIIVELRTKHDTLGMDNKLLKEPLDKLNCDD